MTLDYWQRKYKCQHYAIRSGNDVVTTIPRGGRRELDSLLDYRLVRTDNYKGSYIALLEKRR